MQPIRSQNAIFLAVALALSAPRADVMPLQVGNTWTYKGGLVLENGWTGPKYYRQTEKLAVTVASVSGAAGEYRIFTLQFTDSLTGRTSLSAVGKDTLRLHDTVATWTHSFAEQGDSVITLLSAGMNPFPPEMPPMVRTLLFYHGFSRLHSHPHGTYSALEGGNLPAWRNLAGDAPFYGTGPINAWYVEDVGLYWMRFKGGGGCDGTVDRELALAAFNGKAVDLGLTPDSMAKPLAKEARIACGIRAPGAGPVSFAFGAETLDPLGRKTARSAPRPAGGDRPAR